MRPDLAEPDLDSARILEGARAAAPVLRAEAADNEERRQLSPATVEALRATGVFRMPMPRHWGGPEVDIVTQCEVLEELSAADGAAGWCAMIGCDGGYYTAAMSEEAGRRLYTDLDAVTAGWLAPSGALHRRGDDYVLDGRWQFGSGVTHADVVVAGAIVHEDGHPVLDPEGRPDFRIAMLPADRFEILDTWYTTGLAGSGSHDYRAEGAVVPGDQTFRLRDLGATARTGTLYAWPGTYYSKLPAVPLGIARSAIAAAEEILVDKVLLPENRPAREDPRIRRGVALAHARVDSARLHFHGELGALWATLEAGRTPSQRARAALAGAIVHTTQACRDAVRELADVVGSASIYRRCLLERHVRDLTVVGQHVIAQDRMFEIAGALWLDAREAIAAHPFAAEGLV